MMVNYLKTGQRLHYIKFKTGNRQTYENNTGTGILFAIESQINKMELHDDIENKISNEQVGITAGLY